MKSLQHWQNLILVLLHFFVSTNLIKMSSGHDKNALVNVRKWRNKYHNSAFRFASPRGPTPEDYVHLFG